MPRHEDFGLRLQLTGLFPAAKTPMWRLVRVNLNVKIVKSFHIQQTRAEQPAWIEQADDYDATGSFRIAF
jgi:hypothetical protein